MDFFTHQENARKKTGLLMTYLMLAIAGITLSVYCVIRLFVYYLTTETDGLIAKKMAFFNLELLLGVSVCTLMLVIFGALFKLLALRSGGAIVAKSLGGRLIPQQARNPNERKILNIVEEMAIASGLPPPPVYLIPEKKSINAFAAGYRPETAVIGVTTGAINALSRDELQGVMAHEFSHILNGDMRMNIRLIGVLYGILLIALLGYKIIRGAAEAEKGSLPFLVLGGGLVAIGQIGVFFGHMIKSAVSRQREFLADASAVQFTRYPEGLSGALKKIGGLKRGSHIRHPKAEEASHMYFSNGLRRQAVGMLATHPPLHTRVKRLDPSFGGKFERLSATDLFAASKQKEPTPADSGGLSQAMPPIFKDIPIPDAAQPIILGTILAGSPSKSVLDSVGNPEPAHLEVARALLASIPDTLRDTAGSPDGARALIFAQLLRFSEDQRPKMLEFLERYLQEENRVLIQSLEKELADLPTGLYMPLAELCVPGLRELEAADYRQFKRLVQALVELDKNITLFEFALGNILFRTLDVHFDGEDRKPFAYYALTAIVPQASALLSAMARLGQATEEEAETAFYAAIKDGPKGSNQLIWLPPEKSRLRDIQHSLDTMNVLAYPIRKHVLQLCLACLLHDGKINIRETELFRAIAASLGCPVPVWLVGGEAS